jgi:Secretion system C-terminal sorting domain
MKKFYFLFVTILCLSIGQINAQNGPNLLGARGTFSAPVITPNTKASACTMSGSATYNPVGNVGNALAGCTSQGSFLPCSDYKYTAASNGLNPEFTYTLVKTIGDNNGGNCLKGDWRGQDHTGDGGYFMAVNGAPNGTYSPVFYQIKAIPVCIGTTYEFSAYVLNILPSSSTAAVAGSEPNISFKVNGVVIANSGKIPYTAKPTWVKVGGSFTATTNTVDLQVVNATAVASGNDLGLDDISFSVLQSNIVLSGSDGTTSAPNAVCEGSDVTINYTIKDSTQTNIWYKWQKSTDGGATYVDSSVGAKTATFVGNSYTLPLSLHNVNLKMNGYKYRLVVSTSQVGLSSPGCTYLNEYTLIVNSCAPTPVTLTSFNGKYSNGAAYLDWQTSQELNSDHFDIYKSTDGQEFSLAGTVKSAGFSSTPKSYSFIDNNVNGAQYVYYRLKQTDANGKYTFSSVVKISLDAAKAGMEVFPNPFSSNFTASFSATKAGSATVILRNTIGQPVFQQTIKVNKGNNSSLITNLPVLNTGVYYLSITNDELNYNSKLQKR